MDRQLDEHERKILLDLARWAIEAAVTRAPLPRVRLETYPEPLQQDGASFITLTKHGHLRGCIGALEAYQPLVHDVVEHAVAAALDDYRFQPVSEHELADLRIEISRLTAPVPLEYTDQEELLAKLVQGVDGVVIRDGGRRATFLPQVWQQIPTKEAFLTQLCLKMGASPDLWRIRKLQVLTYRVEEFAEEPG